MRAKFGLVPTAVSKILSFKFISRSLNILWLCFVHLPLHVLEYHPVFFNVLDVDLNVPKAALRDNRYPHSETFCSERWISTKSLFNVTVDVLMNCCWILCWNSCAGSVISWFVFTAATDQGSAHDYWNHGDHFKIGMQSSGEEVSFWEHFSCVVRSWWRSRGTS